MAAIGMLWQVILVSNNHRITNGLAMGSEDVLIQVNGRKLIRAVAIFELRVAIR